MIYVSNNSFKQILGELYNWTLLLFGTSKDPLEDNGHVRDAVFPKQRVKDTEMTGTCVTCLCFDKKRIEVRWSRWFTL